MPSSFPSTPLWGGTTWKGYLNCRKVKTGFCQKRRDQWKQVLLGLSLAGNLEKNTYVPLWDQMKGSLAMDSVFSPFNINSVIAQGSLANAAPHFSLPATAWHRRRAIFVNNELFLPSGLGAVVHDLLVAVDLLQVLLIALHLLPPAVVLWPLVLLRHIRFQISQCC